MKELEKTKRISIASTLFILIVLIAVLSFERPKHMYKVKSVNTLEKITSTDYMASLDAIDEPNTVLVDVRSQFEFEKGHLENAINIYAPEILTNNNSEVFDELKNDNKKVLLYGASPNEVNAPFLVLYQLGYDVKILCVEISYDQNNLISKNITMEKSNADITAFINESVKKAAKFSKKKITIKKPPKKVIVVKKKKKAPAEGGC